MSPWCIACLNNIQTRHSFVHSDCKPRQRQSRRTNKTNVFLRQNRSVKSIPTIKAIKKSHTGKRKLMQTQNKSQQNRQNKKRVVAAGG